MKITKADLAPSRNMLKALGKGKWELEGMEIMAFAQMMQWFSGIQKAIEIEVTRQDEDAKRAEAQKESPILEAKPVEDPIKHDIAKPPRKSKEK
jgi:hypothetical protein